MKTINSNVTQISFQRMTIKFYVASVAWIQKGLQCYNVDTGEWHRACDEYWFNHLQVSEKQNGSEWANQAWSLKKFRSLIKRFIQKSINQRTAPHWRAIECMRLMLLWGQLSCHRWLSDRKKSRESKMRPHGQNPTEAWRWIAEHRDSSTKNSFAQWRRSVSAWLNPALHRPRKQSVRVHAVKRGHSSQWAFAHQAQNGRISEASQKQ